MKLGLIYPFDADTEPPYGLASIATYLREYMGFSETRIIDVNYDDPVDTVRRWKPDIVGISALTRTYASSIRIAREIREFSDIPLILGGVHISLLPGSLHNVFDMGVVGEGEQTMLDLMQLYRKEKEFQKEKLKDIPGLVYEKDKSLAYTEKRGIISPLDSIPIPDRSYMNKEYFKPHLTFWGEESHSIKATMLTARGCPYRCTFCPSTKFWQHLRQHSTERVFREMKMLIEDYKADHIQINDDLFTFNKGRLREIRTLLKEDGLLDRITMTCMARANFIDDELCEILVGLNVRNLNFGFESGSERVLQSLKKEGVTIEKIKNAVKTCRKHEIHVSGSFIMGSPGETIEDMEKTVELIGWMADEGVDISWTFIMTPYPGTEVWEIAKERGVVSDDMDWEDPENPLYDLETPLLLDKSIDITEFKRMWDKANAEIQRMKNPQRRLSRLRMRFKHEPVKTIKTGIKNPGRAMSFLKRTISSNILGKKGKQAGKQGCRK